MRTLKTFLIFGLAVLLLGFITSCKKVKNPYSPDIPKIIDNNDNNDKPAVVSEVTVEYYGAPVTAETYMWKITLLSATTEKILKPLYVPPSLSDLEYEAYGKFLIFKYEVTYIADETDTPIRVIDGYEDFKVESSSGETYEKEDYFGLLYGNYEAYRIPLWMLTGACFDDYTGDSGAGFFERNQTLILRIIFDIPESVIEGSELTLVFHQDIPHDEDITIKFRLLTTN